MTRKTIVFKIGSNLIAGDYSVIDWLGLGASILMKDGKYFPVIVTSGAIAAGKIAMNVSKKTSALSLSEKQALSAIGQPILMSRYREAFSSRGAGIKVAQVLLTRGDFASRQRFSSIRATILSLIDYGVVPIINENDTVATDEIKFGDNDELSALVAAKIGAERLVLLTDVEGVYNGEFRKENLIKVVEKITPEIKKIVSKKSNLHGTGGMVSKIRAAEMSTASGITTIITKPYDSLFADLINFDVAKKNTFPSGTIFLPNVSKRQSSSNGISEHLDAKHCWIAFGARPKGVVFIDEGAKQAILKKGSSLLASGVMGAKGEFTKGDVVFISYKTSNKEEEVGRGIVNYSSDELSKIKGAKSSEIPRLLGDKNFVAREVIHRDNMVILKNEE